jgi:5'-methylthioadenosine phosphorylase
MKLMSEAEIAVIGGSGLYDMDGLTEVTNVSVETPFGAPSDQITLGKLHGEAVAFLPRHGRGHVLTPSEVPYRANIYALKSLGVRYIISVSACGSLREDYRPGHIVIPDQIVDFTKGIRQSSYFGRGLVAHVGVPSPFSPELSGALAEATNEAGGIVHQGGSFITIEGPRFSTKGESLLFRSWGISIIGMTTSPEAFLAAEAEIAYACMAHVTDYDAWHDTEQPVTVDMVIKTLSANTELAQTAIRLLAQRKSQWAREFRAHNNMSDALSLVTDWDGIDEDVKQELGIIINKYIPS